MTEVFREVEEHKHDSLSHIAGRDSVRVRTAVSVPGTSFTYRDQLDFEQRKGWVVGKRVEEIEIASGEAFFDFYVEDDLDDREGGKWINLSVPRAVMFELHAWLTGELYGVDNPNNPQ